MILQPFLNILNENVGIQTKNEVAKLEEIFYNKTSNV
jgi:hypothetical protein